MWFEIGLMFYTSKQISFVSGQNRLGIIPIIIIKSLRFLSKPHVNINFVSIYSLPNFQDSKKNCEFLGQIHNNINKFTKKLFPIVGSFKFNYLVKTFS